MANYLLHSRGELLGFVDAADVQGAEAAAAAQFRLDDFQSRRLRGLVSRRIALRHWRTTDATLACFNLYRSASRDGGAKLNRVPAKHLLAGNPLGDRGDDPSVASPPHCLRAEPGTIAFTPRSLRGHSQHDDWQPNDC